MSVTLSARATVIRRAALHPKSHLTHDGSDAFPIASVSGAWDQAQYFAFANNGRIVGLTRKDLMYQRFEMLEWL
jgi:hypothetical protein